MMKAKCRHNVLKLQTDPNTARFVRKAAGTGDVGRMGRPRTCGPERPDIQYIVKRNWGLRDVLNFMSEVSLYGLYSSQTLYSAASPMPQVSELPRVAHAKMNGEQGNTCE